VSNGELRAASMKYLLVDFSKNENDTLVCRQLIAYLSLQCIYFDESSLRKESAGGVFMCLAVM